MSNQFFENRIELSDNPRGCCCAVRVNDFLFGVTFHSAPIVHNVDDGLKFVFREGYLNIFTIIHYCVEILGFEPRDATVSE